jgi:hypothetical protein
MRTAVFILATLAVVSARAYAEERRTVLPEIEVRSPPPTSDGRGGCAGHGADQKSLDCLNQKFKQQVEKINPPDTVAPLDARSQDLKVGVVNMPAVKQQYGPNFGHSVIPFRPPQPTFAPGLGR